MYNDEIRDLAYYLALEELVEKESGKELTIEEKQEKIKQKKEKFFWHSTSLLAEWRVDFNKQGEIK